MATDFLSRILPPLPQPELGDRPCYYMVGIQNGQVQHHPFTHIADGYSIAKNLSGRYNTYIALAGFNNMRAGRKAMNAASIRCIWADIDVGKDANSYPTQAEAINALKDFVVKTGLKPSILVSTGVGIAAYWCFDKAYDIPTWKKLAAMFAALCRQEGLVIDPHCTEDAARIMRMPNTLHMKSGNMAQVLIDKGLTWAAKNFFGIIADKLQDIGKYLGVKPAPLPTQAPAMPPPLPQTNSVNSIMQSAFAGIGQQPIQTGVRGTAKLIVDHCGQILTGGMCSEPKWHAMMTVLKRCPDGRQWAHELSAMDTMGRYNYQDTETKYDQAAVDKPCSCNHFNNLHAGICDKCPYWGKITTPAQLSVPSKREAGPVPVEPVSPVSSATNNQAASKHLIIPDKFEYPAMTVQDYSFSVDKRGILYHYADKDETGALVQKTDVICSSQLYYLYSCMELVDKAPHLTHWFEVIHSNGRRLKTPFVIARDLGLQTIMKWFAEAGMIPMGRSHKPQLFLDFMNAYLRNITAKGTELSTVKEFGWNKYIDPKTQEETDGFVIGKGIVTDTGLHDINFGDVAVRIADDELTVKGTLEKWKEVPRMYRKLDQKAAQFAICLAFAAPLMKYCPGTATSAIFSLWSNKSGLGKTQVIRACGSIWGDPDKQMIQRNSSTVLRMRKLATLNNLPCFMDELTDVSDEDLYSLSYTLVDGREKQKLRSTGDKMVETGSWKTITFTTSNKSFKAAAAKIAGDSEASLLRVMEYECDFKNYGSEPEIRDYIQNCIDICRDNYGLAGPEFIYQLLHNHYDRLLTLTQRIEHWVASQHFVTNERFISNPCGLAMICGRWAKEFGLIDFDMDALEDWVLREFLRHNRKATQELKVHHDELLRQFLLERQNNMLVVQEHIRPLEARETPRGTEDPFIVSCPNQNIYIRKEMDDERVYISVPVLADWCKQKGLSLQVLLKELASVGIVAEQASINLGMGISWLELTPSLCFVFSTTMIDGF